MDRFPVTVHRGLTEPERAEVTALLRVASAADGQHPLGEEAWLALSRGDRGSFSAVLARDGAAGPLVGYAQLAPIRDGWGLEMVVRPGHRGTDERIGRSLLDVALAEARRYGGGQLRYWVPGATDEHHADAVSAGLHLTRTLEQMRLALPLPEEIRATAAPVPIRSFRPGEDEAAWLEVNNRAFADHPEQGGWDLHTIAAREAEPWFDPAGFLLCEQDGELWGSCWTKIHRDLTPVLGEIYVISVDPAHHRHGLGRSLTVAGLDWLAGQGVGVGMLYVDAANKAAVHLYRSLGFEVDHVDRAYEVVLAEGGN